MKRLNFYRNLNLIATISGLLVLGLSELLYRVDETTAMALVQGIGLSLAGAFVAAFMVEQGIKPEQYFTLDAA